MVLVLSILLPLSSVGQTVLDVPLRGQQRTRWCWAASIEMALDYYGNRLVSQCDISRKHEEVRGNSVCPPIDSDCPCLPESTTSCNSPMSPPNYAGAYSLTTILDTFGYSSTVTASTVIESSSPESNTILGLDWHTIKTEIDHCQPLILLVGRAVGSDTGDHYIVVVGYLEPNSNCEHRFLLIKDPWKPCDGCQYALNYDALTGGRSALLGIQKVSLWIHDIKPKGKSTGCPVIGVEKPVFKETLPCPPLWSGPVPLPENPGPAMRSTLRTMLTCFPGIAPSFLRLTFPQQITGLVPYRLSIIVDRRMKDKQQYKRPFDTQQRYLYASPYYHPFEAIMQPYNDPRTTISDCPARQKDGYWFVESFGPCSFLCIPGTPCLLQSYLRFAFTTKMVWVGYRKHPFSVVVYPHLRYSFRRFTYQKRSYYYALTDYKDLDMGAKSHFKANVAYREEYVLRQLHQRANQPN